MWNLINIYKNTCLVKKGYAKLSEILETTLSNYFELYTSLLKTYAMFTTAA